MLKPSAVHRTLRQQGRAATWPVRLGMAACIFFAAFVLQAASPAGTSAGVDFWVTHLEYTQVVQNWSNSIPLVLGKPLVVRVSVQASGDPGPGPGGSYTLDWPLMDVYHGSTHLDTLGPTNRPIQVFPGADPQSYRGTTARTYNFLIPSKDLYADGTTFSIVINTQNSPAETNRTNNSLTRTVRFLNTRPLKVKGELYISPDHPYTDSRYKDILSQLAWVQHVWPVPYAVDYGYGTYQVWTDRTGTDAIDAYWPGADKVIARSDRTRAASSVDSDKTWYVLQPWDTCACGYAYLSTSPSAATGQDNGGANADTGGGASYAAAFGSVMAQELAHSYFALRHTGHTTQGADPNCCADGKINALDSTTYGFDTQRMQVIAPGTITSHAHDFMSYGVPPIWVSDYTYLNLLNGLKASSALSARPLQRLLTGVSASELLLSGTVAGDAGTLDEAYVVDKPAASNHSAGTGQYSLDLRDSSGKLLFTRSFDVGLSDAAQGLSFTEVVPYDPSTTRVELRHGSRLVATLTRSPHPPSVKILTPAAGVHWSGPRKVAWQSSDPDGDLLRYAVQYSADDGKTWLTLATGLSGTSFDVDSGYLQGSRTCLVRVLASDGLNMTVAQSGTFGVELHSPSVQIQSAQAEGRDRHVTLAGAATDADDGPLSGDNLVWSSDRDGRLGTGSTLVAPLSPGVHTITLTAADSDGNAVTTTTNVTVAPGTIPAVPSHLRATAHARTTLVRWHDNARNETHYFVQRATRTRIPAFRTVARLQRNASRFADQRAGRALLYRVRACNARDCSQFAGPVLSSQPSLAASGR